MQCNSCDLCIISITIQASSNDKLVYCTPIMFTIVLGECQSYHIRFFKAMFKLLQSLSTKVVELLQDLQDVQAQDYYCDKPFVFYRIWMMVVKYLQKCVHTLDKVLLGCSWMAQNFTLKKPCPMAKCWLRNSLSFEQLQIEGNASFMLSYSILQCHFIFFKLSLNVHM